MNRGYELRVTRQALADLGLKEHAGPTFDVETEQHHHDVLAAFVSKRSNSPRGQEPTLGVKGEVYNLHARNPWRAVTWYDEGQRVCWLLAASPHDYKLFERRSKAGTLAPSETDYADLAVARDPAGLDDSAERFLDVFAQDGAQLLARAMAATNTEVTAVLAATVDTAVLVEMIAVDTAECADIYIAYRMPPREGFELPDDFIVVCTAALLPEAAIEDIDWYLDMFPRGDGRRHDEVVVRWRKPTP